MPLPTRVPVLTPRLAGMSQRLLRLWRGNSNHNGTTRRGFTTSDSQPETRRGGGANVVRDSVQTSYYKDGASGTQLFAVNPNNVWRGAFQSTHAEP